MREEQNVKWWRGSRGEWYVVAQMALFVLVAIGPATWREDVGIVPPSRFSFVLSLAGIALIVGGGLFAFAAITRVGRHLTPLPHPVDGATLHQGGAYRIVRHPMYFGACVAALGWALVRNGPMTLMYGVVLFVFFDVKARREEAWLRKTYEGYEDYACRVRKLIPFVY